MSHGPAWFHRHLYGHDGLNRLVEAMVGYLRHFLSVAASHTSSKYAVPVRPAV